MNRSSAVAGLTLVVAALTFTASARAQTAVTFDFDTATPALIPGQNVPFDQDAEGLSAHFSAVSGAFSIQTANTTLMILSDFTGNYVYPNVGSSVLSIQFSQMITNLVTAFATAEQRPAEQPTPVRLTAYTNSTNNPPVGSATRAGTYFGANTLPMGTLAFNSATPFNLVTFNIEPGGASGFLLDNFIVKVTGAPFGAITTRASPPAGGTTTGDCNYLVGADAMVEATAHPGYAFVNWTEGGAEVSTVPLYSFTVTTSRALVANFAPLCTVTTTASPAAGGSTVGDGLYPAGTTANVVATPNPGYAFVNWTDRGALVSTWENCVFTVTTNCLLVANFAPACTIVTTPSSTHAGSTSGDGVYPGGATVEVLAVPASGSRFVDWTVNGVSVSGSPSYTFTASANRTLVANFVADPASVTFDFDTGTPVLSGGMATPLDQSAGGLTAHFSATNDPAFSVGAVASSGWFVSRFSGKYLTPTLPGGALDIAFSRLVTSVSLTFASMDFQEILTPTSIQLEAFLDSTASPAVGTATAQGAYVPGDSMPMGRLTLDSAAPFNVVRVHLLPAPAGANEFMLDNVSVRVPVTSDYSVTTTASPGAGGSTSGGGSYAGGSSATVTATPAAGYAFVNWTEGGLAVSSAASYGFTVSGNRTLVANFAPRLSIGLRTATNPVVTWPASAPGVTLQALSTLGSTNWVNVTNGVEVVGDAKQVTLSPLAASSLYRLGPP